MRTYWERLVSEYARISIMEVEQLDFIYYLQLRRDAFITKMNKTEQGQEYLENAYRIEQTRPERNKLREKFGKEG